MQPHAPVTVFSILDLLGVIWRRKLLILVTMVAALALSAAYLSRLTPVYRATVELLIDPQALQVVGKDIIASDASASLNFANVDSQPLVIASTGVLGTVVDSLHLADDPLFGSPPSAVPSSDAIRRARAIDVLRERIVVHRVDPSLVFQITVSHPDAAQAARIANTIADVYFRQGSETRLDTARRANASLLTQTRELRDRLGEAEAAAQRFRAQNGLTSTGQAGLVVDQQLKDLTAQIGTASAQVVQLASRSDQLRGLTRTQVLSGAIPEAVASATISSLRIQFATADAQLARLQASLGSRNPQLSALRAQRDAVLRLLDAEIARISTSAAAETERARANLKTLQTQSAELTRSQAESGEAQIRLRQLESEVEATRSVYNAALDRTKELEQQQQISTSNSRVISEALPPLRASGPSKVLVLAAGALFGLSIGIALSYARELLPGALRTPEALARALNTMVLGMVPGHAPRRRRSAVAPPSDAMSLAGAAQSLRTQLGRTLPATVLLLPVGRTDLQRVGAGLAQALTESGHKTVLFSLDERVRDQAGEPQASALTTLPSRGVAPAALGKELALAVQNAKPGRTIGAKRPATTATKPQEGPEIVLVWADTDEPLLAARTGADAIVLVATARVAGWREARRMPYALGLLARRVAGMIVIDRAS